MKSQPLGGQLPHVDAVRKPSPCFQRCCRHHAHLKLKRAASSLNSHTSVFQATLGCYQPQGQHTFVSAFLVGPLAHNKPTVFPCISPCSKTLSPLLPMQRSSISSLRSTATDNQAQLRHEALGSKCPADAGASFHSSTRLPDMSEVLAQYGWMLSTPLKKLLQQAAASRDAGQYGGAVTFSPKVFLPLTRLCRDSCGYCTFAQPPRPGRRAYMTMEEVLKVAAAGAAAGCSEALLTLGDKPEDRWPQAATELAEMGYGSTLEYVEAAARAVLRETGLLPHINAGVMSEQQLRRLKQVSASQGLMLESTAAALMQPGRPHHNCPDKDPAARLATIEAAGRAQVPYTSGILVGIGDSRADRLHALACLHTLHSRYGHIQELIIQNFRAKPGTAMASCPEPPLEELLWAVAAARIMFGPDMSIQAPPNLSPLEGAALSGTGTGRGGGRHGVASTQGLTGTDNTENGATATDNGGSCGGGGGGGSAVNCDPQLVALQSSWWALLDAGINDWGGISPITRDFVNPERPWPHLAPLAVATAATGKLLLPRLPIYPPYLGLMPTHSPAAAPPAVTQTVPTATSTTTSTSATATIITGWSGNSDQVTKNNNNNNSNTAAAAATEAGAATEAEAAPAWLDFTGGGASVGAAVLRCADSEGYLRASAWVAGRQEEQQQPHHHQREREPEEGAEEGGGAMSPSTGVRATPGRGAGGVLESGEVARVVAEAEKATGLGFGVGGGNGVGGGGAAGREARGPAVPLPRRLQSGGRSWCVAVGVDGAMEGVVQPVDPSPEVVRLLEGVLYGGRPLQQHDIERLLRARGVDHAAVLSAANQLRQTVCGDEVSYVVNRNINYTNVCTYKCSFCAFSKGKAAEELRGPAYVVPYDEIARRTAEAWDRGATEVCMQGGIHPDFDGHTYLRILAAAKSAAPDIHVHAFSPLEVHHGATSLGLSYEAYLEQLAAAGLGSLPGTAAEVLHDTVRAVLCPDKINTATWCKVVSAAHHVGLRTTSTLMFGSVEAGPGAWATHLVTLRGLQQRAEQRVGAAGGSGGTGFTEFVALPFVHMESPVYLKGRARRGPSLHEAVLLHAVARLALHPHIPHIQASWVKMGPERAAQLLAAGADDMGGSIMNESITRAAGATHGQELPPAAMDTLIRAAGRKPRQRTTLYGNPPPQQTARSYGAGDLQPLLVASPNSGSLR